MKSLTLEEIKKLGPCWLETSEGRERFRRIGSRKEKWTAADVLELPKEEVSSEDKLWLVLREEFLSCRVLHLFACEAAEQALGQLENPDPRSIEAIRIKRLWIDGNATDAELSDARDAAWRATRGPASCAAWNAAHGGACRAALEVAQRATRDAARKAAETAARNAEKAVAETSARDTAGIAAGGAVRDVQVQTLLKIIEREKEQ